jgi:hypothetical protein
MVQSRLILSVDEKERAAGPILCTNGGQNDGAGQSNNSTFCACAVQPTPLEFRGEKEKPKPELRLSTRKIINRP